jgi:biopolymer transport protein ExbB
MRIRLLIAALLAVMALSSVASQGTQARTDSLTLLMTLPSAAQDLSPTIDLTKPPTDQANVSASPAPSRQPPQPSAAKTETNPEGLTLGWKQLRELFFGLSSVPMWGLVGCSVLTLMLIIERLTALQVRRVMPRAFVTRFLQRLREGPLDASKAQELTEVCRENGSPISRFFAVVVANHGRPAFEIRVTISDIADSELYYLRKGIRAISGLAMLAPLLGLFGTVLGMISAFHALSQQTGAGKTELLASGISLALVATASGLGVAIIASAAYYYLLGRVDHLIQEMDLLTNQAITLVASDGRTGDSEKRPRPKSA